MSLTTAELIALRPLETQLNDALAEAARIVDQINDRGGEIMMSLWDAKRPGSTVRGRVQSNVMKVSVRSA